MSKEREFSDDRFLIIGGTSKAGTTSLFNYLANHPQICPSRLKETRFFLDLDYPLSSKLRYQTDGPRAYLSFFDCKDREGKENWRFEATPDYLYSPSTPRLIRETLPNVRFIFILREPVSRVRSFYRFGQQRNEIPLNMTFDRYIDLQRSNTDAGFRDRYRHPAFCALQHGRYSLYLKAFLEAFGSSAIHITFYEELRRNPLSFMGSICNGIGIDKGYFQDYSFEIKNQSVKVRSPRLHRLVFEADRKARLFAYNRPRLRSVLGNIGRNVNMMYRKMYVTKAEEVTMSSSTKDFIFWYYREEPTRLKEMLGVEVPWPSYSGSIEPS
jgi:hypothetical protein